MCSLNGVKRGMQRILQMRRLSITTITKFLAGFSLGQCM